MTGAKARRINARISPELARKVAYLERRTLRSTTQVVIDSIERYYDALNDEHGTAADLLEQAGFVGCGSGPADLSSSYKAEIARSIAKKT